MNKKYKLIITITVMLIMLTVIAYSLLMNRDIFPENNIWNATESADENNTNAVNYTENGYSAPNFDDFYSPNGEFLRMRSGRTVNMNQNISTYGMTFKVNSITVTKTRTLPVGTYMDFPDIQVDENKNFIDDNNYFIVNITMTNDLDNKNEQYISFCKLYFNMDDGDLNFNYEMIEYDGKESTKAKDFFSYVFLPLETKTFNLVYYIPDEILNSAKSATLYIYQGVPFSFSEDIRFIDLECWK